MPAQMARLRVVSVEAIRSRKLVQGGHANLFAKNREKGFIRRFQRIAAPIATRKGLGAGTAERYQKVGEHVLSVLAVLSNSLLDIDLSIDI
jgi:hypothetical protein